MMKSFPSRSLGTISLPLCLSLLGPRYLVYRFMQIVPYTVVATIIGTTVQYRALVGEIVALIIGLCTINNEVQDTFLKYR